MTDICWRVADLVRKTVSKTIKYMGKGEIRMENKCLFPLMAYWSVYR